MGTSQVAIASTDSSVAIFPSVAKSLIAAKAVNAFTELICVPIIALIFIISLSPCQIQSPPKILNVVEVVGFEPTSKRAANTTTNDH